jgi:hypothetical protein
MAREKYIIKDSLVSSLTSIGLSDSNFSVWMMFVDAITSVVYTFELIMDKFKSDIEAKIVAQRIGSRTWYIDIAKKFQLGDSLTFTDDGILTYLIEDETKKIIKSASVIQIDDLLIVKVAKLNSNVLTTLSDEELLQFSSYMTNVMIAGTNLSAVSLTADIIYIDADIYYNPIYSTIDVQADLDEALVNFQTTFVFDNFFVLNDFIDYLRQYDSIADVVFNSITGTNGGTPAPIVRKYELMSGYFNYDESNVYNLIQG